MKKYWSQQFWIVSGERPNEYDALKRMEIFEFFRLLSIYEDNQDKILNQMNKDKKDEHSNTRTRRKRKDGS